ncbi:hypothetical protein UFOVP122_61 [uncultured Caudovirales phage]|uniref:Uncharacterized protein n=1 Tax=uncultured Caudovirales phage TaxID=2100421 RepID=A0A6J5L965_9CAUD|nr:hypothetical protein UFOVP122_61 [uncultured Caudovirales phage]
MADDDEEVGSNQDAYGILAKSLGGSEGAILQLMKQRQAGVGAQQQKLMDMMQQQEGPLSQTGMSDYQKAAMMFQAAGALAKPTRSGGLSGLMEGVGGAGEALAGPLSKADEAQRQRQQQLQQLQLARQKLAVEMSGNQGVSPSDMMKLVEMKRANEEDAETFKKDDVDGKPVLVGSRGTIKPFDYKAAGLDQAAIPNSKLTGEEYLATIQEQDPAFAAKVKAVAEGRLAMPPTSSRSPEAQKLLQAVTQYDPEGVNDVSTGARRKLFTSFTAGEDANQIKSLNTVMGHLGKLQQTSIALNNSSYPTLNSFMNAVSVQTGANPVTNFNVTKKAVADELSTVLKGRATEGEVKRWNEAINAAQSPDQLQGAIETAMDLIEGRMQALGNKYEAGMNYKYKTNGGITLLSSDAQKAYNKIKSTSVVTGKSEEGQKTEPAKTPEGKTVTRTGMVNSGPNAGKRVILYSDGTREYQ